MAYPSTYKYSTKIKGNYIRTIILYRDVTTVTLVNEATITHNNYIITIFSLSCIYMYIHTCTRESIASMTLLSDSILEISTFRKANFFPAPLHDGHGAPMFDMRCDLWDANAEVYDDIKKRHSSLLIHIIMNIIDICKRNIHLYANKYVYIYI